MDIKTFIKKKKVFVSKEKFAIVSATKIDQKAFAIINEPKAITLVIDQNKLDNKYVLNKVDNFRLLTFNFKIPFNMVGFIAQISKKLADKGISIFVISSFSTDHILLKENKLEIAKKILSSLGFMIDSN